MLNGEIILPYIVPHLVFSIILCMFAMLCHFPKKHFALYLYIYSVKCLTCGKNYEKDNHNRRGK